jgi:DNA-binding transcriptional ArsR family regulator
LNVEGRSNMEDISQEYTADPASQASAMIGNAKAASEFLKALAHEGRLQILCHLVAGERTVSELETLLDARQAAVSQQLARLRHESLVVGRRDGKTIYYSIGDPKVRLIIETMHALFCEVPGD